MVKRNFSNKKGFTLIELTLSIGLLGLALALTGGVLISVVKKFQQQAAIQEVERNGDSVMRIVEDNVRRSDYVAKDVNGYLITQGPDPVTRVTITRYFGNINGGAACTGSYVFMTTGSLAGNTQDANKLTKDTSSGVKVTGFTTTIYPGNPNQVFVKMDLQSCMNANITKSYQTFITARGTYQ